MARTLINVPAKAKRGEVIAINKNLADSPEQVNRSPYDEGWLIQVEIANAAERAELMSAAQYRAYLKEQETE